jgi:hypothetical protein
MKGGFYKRADQHTEYGIKPRHSQPQRSRSVTSNRQGKSRKAILEERSN